MNSTKDINLDQEIQEAKDILRTELMVSKAGVNAEIYDETIKRLDEQNHLHFNGHSRQRKILDKDENVGILSYSFISLDSRNKKQVTTACASHLKTVSSKSQKLNTHTVAYRLDPKSNNKYQGLYEKEIVLKRYRDNRVELLRNKSRLEDLKQLRATPSLTPNSRRIIEERWINEKPLYMRVPQVLEEKVRRTQSLISPPKIMKPSKSFNSQDFYRWLDNGQNWVKKRDAKNISLKQELEEEDKDEETTFTPKINKLSEKIVTCNRLQKDTSIKTYEALYQKHDQMLKIKAKKSSQPQYSFHPAVNKQKAHKHSKTQPRQICFEIEEKQTQKSETSATSNCTTNPRTRSHSFNNIFTETKPTNCVSRTKNVMESRVTYSNCIYKININDSTTWRYPISPVLPNKMEDKLLKLMPRYID